MKKNLFVLFAVLFAGILSGFQETAAQSLRLDVRNQQIIGDSLYFDVYMSRVGGSSDFYIGNADFALTFNHGNFSSPTLNYVAYSADLVDHSGDSITSYEANIATSIGTSGSNANKLIINVAQPSFGNQTQFENNIARIGVDTFTYKLGRFYITGISDISQLANLTWVTAGSGTKTQAFTLATATPWKSTKIASYVANNPTLTTQPNTQVTNLISYGKTDTTISISWDRGNGSQVIVLAKQGSAVSTDLPTDGMSYLADSDFEVGSQIGSTSVYVVYKGTDTSVVVGDLDPNTTYHFAAIEMNGSGGYNENYLSASPATASATTNFGEPTIAASNFTITGFTTTTLGTRVNKGNGSSRIFVVREGGAVNGNPVDATTYAADAAFGSGDEIGTGNFVAYIGSDSVVTLTGLDPATVYHVAVYEYNGSGGTENYLTTSPATGSRSTLQTEPALASSTTNFTPTTTTMDFSFTSGDGVRRIILVKEGSAVNADPEDGSGYAADAAFESGDEIGTGNFVVYNGTDDNVTVTGLDPNTTYHFEVFEYNGQVDSANYLTSSTLTGSRTTLIAEPTSQSTNLAFDAWGLDYLTLDVAPGDGAYRIIVAKEGGAVDANPVDGTTYTASAAFGSGTQIGTGNYVVYKGDDDSVHVTGLDTNKRYFFAVYEFNGASTAENYLTTSPLTGDRYTLEEEPASAATAAANTGITTTSITFNWTGGDGDSVLVLVKATSAVNADPADGVDYTANAAFTSGSQIGTGNYVVYKGTGNSVTVTGLTPNTAYHYEIFQFNGGGEANNYLTSATAVGDGTTHQSEPTIQATNFEFTDWTTTTHNLRVTKGDGAFRIIVARAGSAVNANPVDGTTYAADAEFGEGDSTGTGNYVVYAGSDSVVSITGLTANTEYHYAVYEFNGGAGVENYLTTSPLTGDRYTLQTEPTVASSDGDGSAITTTSITFSWDNGNGANQMVVIRQGAAVNADPVDGLTYTADAAYGEGDSIGTGLYVVYSGTGSTVTVTGLNANTTYYFEVFDVNGSGESSNYLTSSTLVDDYTSLADAPTVQASALSISNTDHNSMDLSWTAGNGDSSIVIARHISDLSSSEFPVNGTIYSANSVLKTGGTSIGSGYVVYKGTGTSVTVTNLGQDTTYYFAVFTFNGANGGQSYKTDTSAANKESDNTHFLLDVTAFLEGPMINQTMDTTLNVVEGAVPANQPYGMFGYGGTEENNSLGANVVDWVMIEIRKSATVGAADSNSRVARVAALILNDGSIVAEDGSSLLSINPDSSTYGDMYVVVYHRNHIPVLSANKLTLGGGGAFEYDFTTAANKANASNMIEVNGKYAMYAGNADATGNNIDADDRDDAWDNRNQSGYKGADANMDGNVDTIDRSIIYNNTGRTRQINN